MIVLTNSVNYFYNFEDIKLKFCVYIPIDLRKVLNYFAEKSAVFLTVFLKSDPNHSSK